MASILLILNKKREKIIQNNQKSSIFDTANKDFNYWKRTRIRKDSRERLTRERGPFSFTQRIRDGFKAECLRKIVTLIRNVKDRIAAVRACLCHYRYYLIGLDHDYYVNCWDSGCPFKELCEQIIWDLEEIEPDED